MNKKAKFIVAIDHKAGHHVNWTYIAINGATEAWQARNWFIGNHKDIENVYCARILKRVGARKFTDVEMVHTDGSGCTYKPSERTKWEIWDNEITRNVAI